MRTAPGSVTITAMQADRNDRVVLEFAIGEPIHGRLRDGTGAVHAFSGLLELSAALRRAGELAQLGSDVTTPDGGGRQ
jgi:hypothetical protein